MTKEKTTENQNNLNKLFEQNLKKVDNNETFLESETTKTYRKYKISVENGEIKREIIDTQTLSLTPTLKENVIKEKFLLSTEDYLKLLRDKETDKKSIKAVGLIENRNNRMIERSLSPFKNEN